MHYCLENLSLSLQERYNLIKEAEGLFGEYGYRFQKEPFLPVQILEGTEIHVAAHVIFHSEALNEMVCEDPEISELPTISLPTGFSPEEFQHQLNLLSQHANCENFIDFSKMRAVADRILYNPSLFKSIEEKRPQDQNTLESLQQALFALNYNIDNTTANSYASDFLNRYIEASLKTKTIDQVCAELQPIRNHLCKYDIALILKTPMSGTDLIKWEAAIPNVQALSLTITNTPTFPVVWVGTLTKLSFDSYLQKIIKISENVLANLTSLELSDTNLVDYSVLDNRQKLQEIDLFHINIARVPRGCLSLQKFSASNCPIEDFSPLDNLPKLKSCSFYCLKSLTKVPKGCLKLEDFTASSCPIEDFSGLDGLPNLRSYYFKGLKHLTRLPNGCKHLQNATVKNCPAVAEVNGLHNLAQLNYYNFYFAPLITTLPIGCHNLKEAHIEYCPLIEDFSGLDNLSHLIKCSLLNLPLLTAAPQNCPNLIDFTARRCLKLENYSGLNGCYKLQSFNLEDTPISTWQPNHKAIYLNSIFLEQKEEDEQTVRTMIALSKAIEVSWSLQNRLDLDHPVTMTPELKRYYQAVTGGHPATPAQLEEILETIKSADLKEVY